MTRQELTVVKRKELTKIERLEKKVINHVKNLQ